ncbi:MAG: TIGR02921 family PEP-CTERM protein [Cyanobacteria bacterium J06648_16]
MKTALHLLSHAIFWVWNLAFIGVVYLWILPEFGLEMFDAARMGEIPPAFILSILGILVVPVICTVLGGWRLRKHPILLLRLFYGVEAPLFGLCLLRLFLIRETTPASAQVLLTVLGAIAIFAIETFAGYAAYRRPLAWVQMVGHNLVLLTGLYTGALLLLYTIPALCAMGYSFFFDAYWLQDLGWMLQRPWELLMFLLFVGSCLVFVSMPYVMVNFYVRSWHRIRSAFGKQHGQNRSWATTGTVLVLSLALFGLLQWQPQAKAFDLLETVPETPVARQTLVQQSDTIRAGLLNAYLSRYRYLSPAQESNQLREWYRYVFNMPKSGAQFFQNIHNGILSPFLYKGWSGDVDKAATLYAEFFDAPIQRGEQQAVRNALQATANRDGIQASALNQDQKIVRLAEQTVTVKEQGDWAEVEVYESYENTTFDDQEIFYSFALPESATITGLWLADSGSTSRFPFVVSPRGAAQQVYNGEVERANNAVAEDPALLEQVGPRQYRLRVFPIPAAADFDSPGGLQLWMNYQVAQANGGWPLPQLTEKRNIFWTEETTYQRFTDQGRETATLPEFDEDHWFEPSIPAQKQVRAQTHTVDFSEGYRVTAEPVGGRSTNLKNKTLAVVLDTSYSMGRQIGALEDEITFLQALQKHNTLDLYLTTAVGDLPKPPKHLKAFRETVFYGSLQPADMLQQFAQQSAGKSYDAVLLMTDEGSYELADAEIEVPELTAPLWLVHLGSQLPAAYEDQLLQALQNSKGGVVTNVDAAAQRIASEAGDVLDGYRWTVEPVEGVVDAGDEAFRTVAARQAILQRSREVNMTVVENLDGVHAIAKRTGIVTPYSSMLVLVNDRQRQLLAEAEASADRFDREVETGQDDLTDPNNPLNAVAVPEPGVILGLGTIAAALVRLKRQQKTIR